MTPGKCQHEPLRDVSTQSTPPRMSLTCAARYRCRLQPPRTCSRRASGSKRSPDETVDRLIASIRACAKPVREICGRRPRAVVVERAKRDGNRHARERAAHRQRQQQLEEREAAQDGSTARLSGRSRSQQHRMNPCNTPSDPFPNAAACLSRS